MTNHTVPTRALAPVLGSWLATALGIAGVLVPKCPLCAAAYLCLFGVSAGSAQAIVQLGVPLASGLVVASAIATALFFAHRGRRARILGRSAAAAKSAVGDSRGTCCGAG